MHPIELGQSRAHTWQGLSIARRMYTGQQIVIVTNMWPMCEPRRGWVHASGTSGD